MTDLIWDMAHPVGSVMQVANGFDPNTVRGTWERIEGRFLLASSGSRPRGSEGGEAAHTLTVEEMPSHAHYVKYQERDNSGSTDGWGARMELGVIDYNQHGVTDRAGGGNSHNNMPPYMAVDTWRRAA